MLPTRPTSNWLESNSPSLHQTQDGSVDCYNTERPHRSLRRRTPLEARSTREKAGPTGRALKPRAIGSAATRWTPRGR